MLTMTFETDFLTICQFMDYKFIKNVFQFPENMYNLYKPSIYELETGVYEFSCDISELEFHTSFDWLMPVIKKIFSIKDQFNKKLIKILQNDLIDCNIENCFKTVIYLLILNK